MSNKLYVGNLPWSTDNMGLREMFETYGPVEDARVVMDRETGRSRGFGFVTFESTEDAESALAQDGQEIDGRQIRVNVAREREPRGFGGRPPRR